MVSFANFEFYSVGMYADQSVIISGDGDDELIVYSSLNATILGGGNDRLVQLTLGRNDVFDGGTGIDTLVIDAGGG